MEPTTMTLYIAYSMIGIFAIAALIVVFYSEHHKKPQQKHRHIRS